MAECASMQERISSLCSDKVLWDALLSAVSVCLSHFLEASLILSVLYLSMCMSVLLVCE